MSQDPWTKVDRYLTDQLVPRDAALERALEAADAAGLPEINVAPNQGKMLHVLALSVGAKNILEIGTLGGYSAIWLARALPQDGRLVTLELDEKHANVARANLVAAGLSHLVEVRVGRAIELLPKLEAKLDGEGRPPFDLVFIDADKESTAEYFDWAVRLSRPGSLIVVDNVMRGGAIADPANADVRVEGMRRFLSAAGKDPRVTITAVQTVGSKGHDGFALAVVNG
jgi:predicted O-methyltransferase YrrM